MLTVIQGARRWHRSDKESAYRCMGGPFVPGLPSQALRASSPKGEAFGRPGHFRLDA